MTKKYKCRVEYLESTGTQYIDTGLNGKNNIDFYYKCIFTNLDGIAQCVGGNWSGAGTSTVSLYLGLIRTNGNFAYHYDGTQSPVVVMNTTVQDTPYSIQGHMWVGEQYMVVNGTKSSVGTISSTFTSSLNMYLFGINNNGLSNPAYMKLYYCKIYDNGTLARDFIPVLDNSGRPAMYDQVSGQLFYNQGTGDDFNYGRQIIPVEYLESTGTQYIDTGVILSSTNKVEALAEYTGKPSTGSSYIFGTYGSSKNFGINADLQNSGNFYGVWYNQGTITASTPKPEIDTRYKVEVSSNGIYINDTLFSTVSGTFTGSNPAYLFWANGTGQPKSIMKLYSCQMWNGSNLVRDFIPCIDENNTPFMFDKVNNTVYLNSGTGQFKFGSNVEKAWGVKKLRRKLALALANLKKKRPYYCEVEYLENTSGSYANSGGGNPSNYGSYINTGINPKPSGKVKIGIRFNDWGSNTPFQALFGGYDANTKNFGVVVNMKSDTDTTYFMDGTQQGRDVFNYAPDTYYDFEYIASQKSLSINGDTYVFTSVNQLSTQSNLSIYLFTDNSVGSGMTQYDTTYTMKGKIYYFQYYEGDNLIMDLIPVLDWNMTPCMYDKISGQFFYNTGTGSFTYGREIHYVEYLESTGTQYIDTGVKLTNNHSVELDYQLTNASQSRAGLFGALNMSGSNQGRFGSILSPSNSYMEHGYGSGNDYWQQGLPDTNRHLLYQNKNEIYFDGTLIHTFNTATFNLVINAYLGNFLYTNYTPAKAKYYGSRWWDDNELVRDYKPAIDENGVCFWFDRVGHTIYDNAGTDAFQYPAKETTYTANAGTPAYIDLGIKYKSSMSIRGKFTRDAMGASGSVLLVTNTTTPPLIYFPALTAGGAPDRYVWRRSGYSEQRYDYDFTGYPVTEEAVLDAINDTLTVNGDIVKTGMIAGMNGYSSPYQSNSNLYMFSIVENYAGNGKIYYLQIDDGTTPVMDLVPAYKDGAAGFYNKITGTFYGNASTNTNAAFTAGKIVEHEYE